MITTTTTVAIVGNGPVGQTAALLLAKYGVDVVVLEQRPGRQPVGSRSICQQRDVLDIWGWVGAGQRIAAEGVTWSTARTFCRDRELFSYQVAGAQEASAYPPFVNISQHRTEQILDEQIDRCSGVDVRWAWRVTAVHPAEDMVVVEGETPDGPAEIQARYVLGCAGARDDVVRAAIGVQMDGSAYDDRFLICDIRTDLPGWARERRFYFDPVWNPGRQVLIHPCPDSTYRIDWQVPPGYDLAADEASGGLHRRITAVIGDRPYELVWRSVYGFGRWLAGRFAVGRVLLLGDDAHVMAPFGARGLNSGVQDAENVAWKIAFALRGLAPDALVSTYEDERRSAAQENLDVVGTTMDFLVPHTDEQRSYRREVLSRAGDDDQARSLVDSGRLAEPFWYVDSPIVEPNRHRPFRGRPPRGGLPDPAPGVLLPDLPPPRGGRRLRDVCRGRLTALAFGAEALAGARAAAERLPLLQVVDAAAGDVAGLGQSLEAELGEVWLVRPDVHVAAVLEWPDAAQVAATGRRVLGHDLATRC